jgi:hypothetical protein
MKTSALTQGCEVAVVQAENKPSCRGLPLPVDMGDITHG